MAELTTSIETITPEIAAEWLEKYNKNNFRELRPHHVRKLAKQMQMGMWYVNGEAITFRPNGTLQDGQHRLHAVVYSGTTIKSLVARNVPDDRGIDVGMGRTGQDYIRGRGFENRACSPLIKYAVCLHEYWIGVRQSLFAVRAENITPPMVEYYADQLGVDRVMWAASLYDRVKRSYHGHSVCATLMLCASNNRAAAHAFVEQIADGVNLRTDDPAYILRERFGPARRLYSRSTAAAAAARGGIIIDGVRIDRIGWTCYFVQAWNKFVKGEPLGRMSNFFVTGKPRPYMPSPLCYAETGQLVDYSKFMAIDLKESMDADRALA